LCDLGAPMTEVLARILKHSGSQVASRECFGELHLLRRAAVVLLPQRGESTIAGDTTCREDLSSRLANRLRSRTVELHLDANSAEVGMRLRGIGEPRSAALLLVGLAATA